MSPPTVLGYGAPTDETKQENDSMHLILFPIGKINRTSKNSLVQELMNFDPFYHAAMFGDPVYDYQGWPMSAWF